MEFLKIMIIPIIIFIFYVYSLQRIIESIFSEIKEDIVKELKEKSKTNIGAKNE